MRDATSTTAYRPFSNELLKVLLFFSSFLLRYVR